MNLRTMLHVGGYPNHCKVYRIVDDNPFKDCTEEKVLYEGDCVFYGSAQMRKYTYANVVKADFAVSFPRVIRDPELKIEPGDLITVDGEFDEPVEVVTCMADQVFGMGTTVFFNRVFN